MNGVVEITVCRPSWAPGSRTTISGSAQELGFILLELLLGLALTGILACGLMAVYWMSSSVCRFESDQALMQFALRDARNWMLKDVWKSDSIQVLNSRYGTAAGPGVAGSCVKIVVGTVKDVNIDYTGIYYYVQNNRFYRERNQLNDKENDRDDTRIDKMAIADDLVSSAFSCPADGNLEYTLTCRLNSDTSTLSGIGRSRVDSCMSFGR